MASKQMFLGDIMRLFSLNYSQNSPYDRYNFTSKILSSFIHDSIVRLKKHVNLNVIKIHEKEIWIPKRKERSIIKSLSTDIKNITKNLLSIRIIILIL